MRVLNNFVSGPSFHPGRSRLPGALVWLLCQSVISCATEQETTVPGDSIPPGKGDYTLFNPTPARYLRELTPDRPDKTDSPFTVDAGHTQLELDFANLTDDRPTSERSGERFAAYEVAPMNIKIGLFNDVDFQLIFTPERWECTDDNNAGTRVRKYGFDGVTPRLKINIAGNDGGFFALALIPFVKLPLSSGKLDNGSIEGGLGIPYSFDIPGWDVGFQTTLHFNRDCASAGRHTEFDNSVSIGHPIVGKKLSASVEFFSCVSSERGAGWVGTVDTWLTYALNENTRLDAGVYIGVTPAVDNWHPFVGTTRRF